ncbi:hypothetical protein D5E69_14175 [Rossellomorea marisflavi]|uniref:phage tail spike protein n=1 Tax=Rossellomorea marisflavi TaxID=189381 RepID=UPI001316ECE0|nr:phage tail spike protein [Rossellomorea marisflavi]QHA36847.1 hypothetical protein D5E69_14175 [Rossellomorea marisflavi]
MLELTTLSGESHFLANQLGLSRKQAVNGNRSLSFLLPKTDVNAHAFNLVEEECFITDQSTKHRYRIKQVEQRVHAQTPVKSVFATHEFFDLIDVYRYDTLTTGVKTIAQILDFIFNGTGWTYSVINAFNNLEFENFGDDNCIALFNKAIQRFGFEFELRDDKHVTIRNQIGNDADLQFRYNHNVKTFKHTVDTSNLSTYIRGEGKVVNDVPVVTAEYTSPNAAIFGIRHAKPYTNETIIHQPTLLASLKRQLIDAPEVSIELEFSVLKDAGYLSEKPGLGDRIPTIYEPLGIDLDLRVMEIEDYPGTNKAPRVTLSTLRKSYGSAITDFTKRLFDEFFDSDTGKLKYDVLDEATRRATEALNNSLTELEYPPGMGIVARDPNDPLRFVAFRSAGLGVTTDGGITFPNAITADGINTNLLTAGQINTNRIRIFGGDLEEYTLIEGPYIESRGRHTRSWRGKTETNQIRLKFENGYLRARNDTLNRSLYFSDFGISTYADAVGNEDASGTLAFRDTTYSTASGLTVHSVYGVVALRSDENRVILDASQTVNIESDEASVYFRPMKNTRPGINEFRLWVKDNGSSSETDGVLTYGSPNTNYAAGIRFQKTTAGDPTIFVTNGNGDMGTGKLDADKVGANDVTTRGGTYSVYWNGRGGGTLGGSGANDFVLQAGGIKTTGDNFYLGCGPTDGEVRVTNHLGYNDGSTISYRPIKASEYRNGSSVLTKQNIEPVTERGLDVINKLEIKRYILNEDVNVGNYSNWQIGVLSELSPEIATQDLSAINVYKYVNYLALSVQELSAENKAQAQEIADLRLLIEGGEA